MSSGPKNVTSTTNSTPPEFLLQPLQNIANAAGQNFSNRIQPGNESPGNSLINDSQDLTGRTVRGEFLSPDSNPFLQQTFDRAADLTQNRLSSEFAGSGRDLDAARPARSEELQTLSSNIFGGNFQRERDRQQGAIGQAQQLDPLDRFVDQISRLIPGAGGSTRATQPVFKTGLF